MLTAFNKAKPILEKIIEAGYEAYFVGGAVRDFLLGKPIEDVDIATSATPDEIKKIFGKTIDVGIAHGTVIVLWKHLTYEITTFRSESPYVDHRRPTEVFFIRSLNEDLRRRDFTMNALAMDKEGLIMDPFHGTYDIENKIIKTVGDPKERFTEDALRMMRAVRFVSQLSFTIECNTFNALRSLRDLLENISVERKAQEFEKILIGKYRVKAINILLQTKIYENLPGLSNSEQSLKKILDLNCLDLDSDEMWSLLLYQMNLTESKAINNLLRMWKLSVKKIKRIETLLMWLHYRTQNEWTVESLYSAKLENVLNVERIYNVIISKGIDTNIDKLMNCINNLPIKDRSDIQATGNDLMKWLNRPGGIWVKQALSNMEKAILSGLLENNKKAIREWLIQWNQQ